MKIILTKDVDTLGDSGDVITVSDGYARNYLFPKNIAIKATEGSLKDLQSRIERIRAKANQKNEQDNEKADKVTALESLTLEANAGDTGKLFGTITTKELARVLLEKTSLTIERKQINVNAPINKVGDYEINVKFSSKVSATLPIKVVAAKDTEQQSIIDEVEAQENAEDEALRLAEDSPTAE